MFINVAAEATTAIMIIFLLSSDEVSIIWIFEQSNLVDAKILVLWILFLVDFVDVSRATSGVNFIGILFVVDVDVAAVVLGFITVVAIVVIDVFGVCVAGTNLVIGS